MVTDSRLKRLGVLPGRGLLYLILRATERAGDGDLERRVAPSLASSARLRALKVSF